MSYWFCIDVSVTSSNRNTAFPWADALSDIYREEDINNFYPALKGI